MSILNYYIKVTLTAWEKKKSHYFIYSVIFSKPFTYHSGYGLNGMLVHPRAPHTPFHTLIHHSAIYRNQSTYCYCVWKDSELFVNLMNRTYTLVCIHIVLWTFLRISLFPINVIFDLKLLCECDKSQLFLQLTRYSDISVHSCAYPTEINTNC